MLLIVTERFDPHVDFVEPFLNELGIAWRRFHLGDFPTRVTAGYEIDRGRVSGEIRMQGDALPLSAIRAVWYRRTESSRLPPWLGDADKQLARRESAAFIQGLWRLLTNAVWVSNPNAIRSASSKAEQVMRASRYGFSVPATCVSNDPGLVRGFLERVGVQVIYKPHTPIFVDQPGGKKGVVYTTLVDTSAVERLEEIRLTPGIFQVRLEKKLELRVTVVDQAVFACAIDSQSIAETETDWRAHLWDDPSTFPPHHPFDLPEAVADACRALVSSYGLAFGAIDLVIDPAGAYYFLELNPNGQWAWVQQATGLPIADALCRVFDGSSCV